MRQILLQCRGLYTASWFPGLGWHRSRSERSAVSDSAESVNYFAENVSRMAAMHGLSLERLARLLGLSPQTISTWRAGNEPRVAPH